MRALVVQAHPSAESFNGRVLGATLRGLEAGGHEVRTSRLYEMGFVAAMSAAERRAYESPEPILDEQVREQAESVQWADAGRPRVARKPSAHLRAA